MWKKTKIKLLKNSYVEKFRLNFCQKNQLLKISKNNNVEKFLPGIIPILFYILGLMKKDVEKIMHHNIIVFNFFSFVFMVEKIMGRLTKYDKVQKKVGEFPRNLKAVRMVRRGRFDKIRN